MFSRILRYFFQGLLLVAPIALTFYVIYAAFTWIDQLLKLDSYPGLGLLVVLASVAFIGYLSSTFLVKPIVAWGERILNTIPIVNIIYSSVKDLLEAFVGNKKKFNHPVRVQMDESGKVFRLGFITEKSIQLPNVEQPVLAVYLPHSYNISGNLYFFAPERVEPLNKAAADVMKYIVSGGVSGQF